MSVKIFVVSLARAVDRKEFMKAQFDRLDLEYEFVEAFDALNISDDELDAVNQSRSYAGRLTKGEVACARSHAMACERLSLDRGCEFGLILEDDVIIGPTLSSILTELQGFGEQSGVVLLYMPVYREIVFSVRHALKSGHSIVSVDEPAHIFGTQAYFLSKEKAKDFSREILPVKTIADDWKRYLEVGVFSSLVAVFPFPVLHAEFISVVKGSGASKPLSGRSRLKNYLYTKRIFPIYQLLLMFRRNRAEARQRRNIMLLGGKYKRTYRL